MTRRLLKRTVQLRIRARDSADSPALLEALAAVIGAVEQELRPSNLEIDVTVMANEQLEAEITEAARHVLDELDSRAASAAAADGTTLLAAPVAESRLRTRIVEAVKAGYYLTVRAIVDSVQP